MKIFYQDYTIDEGIESNDPREADLSFALELFYELADDEGNFFGIEDSEERCIQFAWISQDKWLVDIPKPPDFMNYQKYADYDECVEMIKRVYELNEVVQFGEMAKVDTSKESLDEKLGIEKVTVVQSDNSEQNKEKSNTPSFIETASKNQPYKTYKGKSYTEEEWKIFEEKLYQEYLRKKGK